MRPIENDKGGQFHRLFYNTFAKIDKSRMAEDYKCKLFNSLERPKNYVTFQADGHIYGESREEAIKIIASLEGIKPNDFI